ncbi:allophanate hydrolase subunit 1 [Deinococcus sp. MIMF12]|uniref:Allophanate hydrolase subunit 1 n=1 Tax=Deinococcus rhizophilus TaxID=3049544 RepID=A0ABT7JJG3_9DEIO|nr:allophanate hydrolase subunit 1 [Deinococcus rhizophilus]MDL2345195.1 allophanate hydrolase subunit 1 [Deinococcus rhizophilus]
MSGLPTPGPPISGPPTEITPLGDAALIVRSVLAPGLRASLAARPLPGVRETVPALDVLTVLYDPLTTGPEALAAALRERLAGVRSLEAAPGRLHLLPVTFGGPDLGWCAGQVGLDEAGFIRALEGVTLTVAFLGFTPGFAFLTGLPPQFQMPRLPTPRERVPAGSVALGGPWAGVYPRETPGGWRVVGHTDTPLFDLGRPEPVLWGPGDRVRFMAADA